MLNLFIPRVAFDHELVPKTNLTLIVQPTRPQCPFKVTGDTFAPKNRGRANKKIHRTKSYAYKLTKHILGTSLLIGEKGKPNQNIVS